MRRVAHVSTQDDTRRAPCQLTCFGQQLVPLNLWSWNRARAIDARTKATGRPEYYRFHERAEGKADCCILGLSRYQRDRAPLDVDGTVQVDP